MGAISGAPGYVWTLEVVVLAAVLVSLRAGIARAAATAVLLLLASVGCASGVVVVPLDLNVHLTSASAWAGFFVVVVCAPLLLMDALASY